MLQGRGTEVAKIVIHTAVRSLAVKLKHPTRSTTQRNDLFTSTYITEKPETQLEVRPGPPV